MKILKKIITFLLLSILLSSNITGLHFYIVGHNDKHTDHFCHDDHDDDHDDGPCDICLLTLNLSNLNFYSPDTLFFEVNRVDIPLLTKNKILNSLNLFYNHYTFKANRNKAPPALT